MIRATLRDWFIGTSSAIVGVFTSWSLEDTNDLLGILTALAGLVLTCMTIASVYQRHKRQRAIDLMKLEPPCSGKFEECPYVRNTVRGD